MKNGYELLVLLTNRLNKADSFFKKISTLNKADFAKNDSLITIGVGILNEIKEITHSIDKNIFLLNKILYGKITLLSNYCDNIFNDYAIVNAYKLYDVLNIDILNLKEMLNNIKKDS